MEISSDFMTDNDIEEVPGRFVIHFKNTNKPPVHADDVLSIDTPDGSVQLLIPCTDGTIVLCDNNDCIIHDMVPDSQAWEGVNCIRDSVLNIQYDIEEIIPGYQ